MARFDPKHILISGATSGVGKALAMSYAKQGNVLFLLGRDRDRLNDVASQCKALGASVISALIDVRDQYTLAKWITEQDQDYPIDLVIANAGISKESANLEDTFESDQIIFDINFQGLLNTIYPIIPLMQKRKKGQIALMSSLASFRGFPRAAAYCSSKAAIKIYGEGLRGKLAKSSIAVNVICPGFVKTPLTDQNDFKMPFIMDSAKAANIIKKGLSKNKSLIAFPWPMYFITRLFMMFPSTIADKLTRRF